MLDMTSIDDIPSVQYVPYGEEMTSLSQENHRECLDKIVEDLLKKYDTVINFKKQCSNQDSGDHVLAYTKQVLHHGCFYLEHRDSLKEDDGDRICRSHRYMLPMFQSSGRKNYAIEMLQFLLHHDYILSECEKAELLWNRLVNVHGLPGRNTPSDLHYEHLNCICKTAVKGLGPNKTKKNITKIGKAVGTVSTILNQYDEDNGVGSCSLSHHKIPSVSIKT